MQYKVPFLSRILRILFTIWLIGGFYHELAEAGSAIPDRQKSPEMHHQNEVAPPKDTSVQVALLYSETFDNNPREQSKGGEGQLLSVPIVLHVQIIVIGAVFILIGTFFVPHLLPQFTGYHEKFARFLDHTVNTYKTMFHVPQQQFSAHSGMIKMVSSRPPRSLRLTGNAQTRVSPHTPRHKHANVSRLQPPRSLRQTSSATGVIGTFFQQSGFAFAIVSNSELRVNSQLSRYKCYGEIPVYVMNKTALNERHIQHIYDRTKRYHELTQTSSEASMAFVIVTTPLKESAYRQIYMYRVNHNFIIIPLSHLLVTKSVRHASCAQQLEEKINASTGQCNLYAMTTPVADSLSFFGYTDMMSRIQNAITHQKMFGIFGLPKSGKTWLMWQLKGQLSHHVTAYIDLQQLPKRSSYLYRKIIDECIRDLGFKYPDVQLPQLRLSWSGATANDTRDFLHDIAALLKCVTAKHPKTKIILLLDGAEQLVPGISEEQIRFGGAQEFLHTLRSITRQQRFLTAALTFSSPKMARKYSAQTSQCQNRIFLSSFTEEGCNQMINDLGAQMGLSYPEEALSRLYYETAGHPYVTRQACSLIAKNLRRSKMIPVPQGIDVQTTVQVRDVEQAVSEYLEYKSDYMEALWQALSPLEQEILKMIATHNSCTLNQLTSSETMRRRRKECQRTIQWLIDNDLIEQCEHKYSVKMGLFERLILTKM